MKNLTGGVFDRAARRRGGIGPAHRQRCRRMRRRPATRTPGPINERTSLSTEMTQ
ncbi:MULTISPECIES: hypothetical protein [Burkholderia]|uniref:hypothetical protein n=1 Tax=Burkholderia TaxID=32008 RepID=UPI000A84CC02|nr:MULTISPECIES: hypothetical protein [Burkholderia]